MPSLRSTALVFFASLLVAISGGCSLTGPPKYVTGEVPAASERVLWEVTRLTLEEQQLPTVVTGFDPKTHSATTLWRISLHPFKGHGFRERAEVSYAAAGPGVIEITVRVEKETNENVAKPLNPEYADWTKAEDDEARAQLILARIQSRLGGGLEVIESE